MPLLSNKLLFVSPNFPGPGGVEAVTKLMTDFLVEEGFQVYILTTQYIEKPSESDSENPSFQITTMPGVLNSEKNRKFIQEFIASKQIGCVFNQGLFSLCHLDASTNPGVHFINTFHGKPFWERDAIRSVSLKAWVSFSVNTRNQIIESLRWFVGKLNVKWAYPSIHSFYQKHIDQCSRFIVLNESYQLLFEKELYRGTRNEKIKAISNPIAELTTNSCAKEKIVLYVGRLVRSSKRVDRLIRIWSRVEPLAPDWKLNIVGDGEDRLYLEKLTSRLQLKRVVFQGYQQSESHYQKASILCLTSSFEGSPLVIPEAQHCGTVPVAFNIGDSIRNLIDDGINGFLVKPFDEKRYSEKLLELMQNPETLKKIASQSPLKVAGRSIQEIGEKWLEILNEL
jgi:glycosyltransferase involved in cell wall biosynthesis